eukprot:RCo000689
MIPTNDVSVQLPASANEYYEQFRVLSVDQKIYHTTAVIVSLTILGCVLVYMKFILVPLTLSFFLAYFLAPIVDLLTSRPWICCSWVTIWFTSGPETQARHWLRKLKPVFDFSHGLQVSQVACSSCFILLGIRDDVSDRSHHRLLRG